MTLTEVKVIKCKGQRTSLQCHPLKCPHFNTKKKGILVPFEESKYYEMKTKSLKKYGNAKSNKYSSCNSEWISKRDISFQSKPCSVHLTPLLDKN